MRYQTSVLICVILALGACRGAEEGQPTPQVQPTPASLTPTDLGDLRWIEGVWRGTGDEVEPFYESYRFLNDSTIETRTFTDSSLTQVADSGRITLAQGVLTSRGGNTAYVATQFDSRRVHFEPWENANNAFTWTWESPSSWTAVLAWTDENGIARERSYRMEHIGETESE